MNRKTRIILHIILLIVLVFSALMVINNRLPRLTQYDTIPADISLRPYALFPLEMDDTNTYRIHLENPNRQNGTALVLAVIRPYTLTINGHEIFSYTHEHYYQRMHIYPLPNDVFVYDIAIHSFQGQRHLKALLTTTASASASILNSKLFSTLIVGMNLSLLFFCLTLFFQKQTEVYLLTEGFAVIATTLMSILVSGAFPVPVTERWVIYIQYFVDAQRIPSIAAIVFFLIPLSSDSPHQILKKHLIPLIIGIVLIKMFLLIHGHRLLDNVISYLIWIIIFRICIDALDQNQPCMHSFTLSCLTMFCLSSYAIATNAGILPNTPLLVYFYIPQLYNLLLMLACTYVVNHRFASKYRQADNLIITLEHVNQVLDKKVEERTAELTQQHKRRRNMMINIFHDLRSPIFSARGCADMIVPENEHNRECVNIIIARLEMLSRLAEQLFLAAKLEDDQITFAFEPIHLNALCLHLQKELTAQIQSKSIKFMFEQNEDIYVSGDGFRLKQAFENLLINSFSFTPVGGMVAMRLFIESNLACIQIQDTGAGIAPEDIPYVFSRYYHGKNSNKQRSSGLGLSISSDIIQKHKGTITVASEIGQGTTFSVYLPLLEIGMTDISLYHE